MTVEIVDPLEVVDVEEAERDVLAGGLALAKCALELLVKIAVVTEAGERVGKREAHGSELPVD